MGAQNNPANRIMAWNNIASRLLVVGARNFASSKRSPSRGARSWTRRTRSDRDTLPTAAAPRRPNASPQQHTDSDLTPLRRQTRVQARDDTTVPSNREFVELDARDKADYASFMAASPTAAALASRRGEMTARDAAAALRELEREAGLADDTDRPALLIRDSVHNTGVSAAASRNATQSLNTGDSEALDAALRAFGGDDELRAMLSRTDGDISLHRALTTGTLGDLSQDGNERATLEPRNRRRATSATGSIVPAEHEMSALRSGVAIAQLNNTYAQDHPLLPARGIGGREAISGDNDDAHDIVDVVFEDAAVAHVHPPRGEIERVLRSTGGSSLGSIAVGDSVRPSGVGRRRSHRHRTTATAGPTAESGSPKSLSRGDAAGTRTSGLLDSIFRGDSGDSGNSGVDDPLNVSTDGVSSASSSHHHQPLRSSPLFSFSDEERLSWRARGGNGPGAPRDADSELEEVMAKRSQDFRGKIDDALMRQALHLTQQRDGAAAIAATAFGTKTTEAARQVEAGETTHLDLPSAENVDRNGLLAAPAAQGRLLRFDAEGAIEAADPTIAADVRGAAAHGIQVQAFVDDSVRVSAGIGTLAGLDELRGAGLPDAAVPEVARLRPPTFADLLDREDPEMDAFSDAARRHRRASAERSAVRAALDAVQDSASKHMTPAAARIAGEAARHAGLRAAAEAALLDADADAAFGRGGENGGDVRARAKSKRAEAVAALTRAHELLSRDTVDGNGAPPSVPTIDALGVTSTASPAIQQSAGRVPDVRRAAAAGSAMAAQDASSQQRIRISDLADAAISARNRRIASMASTLSQSISAREGSAAAARILADPVAAAIAAGSGDSGNGTSKPEADRALLEMPDGLGRAGGGLLITGAIGDSVAHDAIAPADLRGRAESDGEWSVARYIREAETAEREGAADDAAALLEDLGVQVPTARRRVGSGATAPSSYTGVGTLQERLREEEQRSSTARRRHGGVTAAEAQAAHAAKESALDAVEDDGDALAAHVQAVVDAEDNALEVADSIPGAVSPPGGRRKSLVPAGFRSWVEVVDAMASNRKRRAATAAQLSRDRQAVLDSRIVAPKPGGAPVPTRRQERVAAQVSRVLASILTRRLVGDPALYPAGCPVDIADVSVTPDLRTAYVRWAMPFPVTSGSQGGDDASDRNSGRHGGFRGLLKQAADIDALAGIPSHHEDRSSDAMPHVVYDMDSRTAGSARLLLAAMLDERRTAAERSALARRRGERQSRAGRARDEFGDDGEIGHLSPRMRVLVLQTAEAITRNSKELRRIAGRELGMQFVPRLEWHRWVQRERQM